MQIPPGTRISDICHFCYEHLVCDLGDGSRCYWCFMLDSEVRCTCGDPECEVPDYD